MERATEPTGGRGDLGWEGRTGKREGWTTGVRGQARAEEISRERERETEKEREASVAAPIAAAFSCVPRAMLSTRATVIVK